VRRRRRSASRGSLGGDRVGAPPCQALSSARLIKITGMLARFAKSAYWWLVHPLLRRLGGLASPKEKSRTLIEYGRRHGTPTLVETGTYQGTTVAACVPHFERLYTIELDRTLYEAARDRFKNEPTVTVIHGDSYAELSRVASRLQEPAIFWLDAHYCAGPTAKGPHDPPLLWELRAIVERGKPDVILIDDAHHMGVEPGWFDQWMRRIFLRRMLPAGPDYPKIEEIREIVGGRARTFEVQRDIIRIKLAARPDPSS
jgi:hypothetical protein